MIACPRILNVNNIVDVFYYICHYGPRYGTTYIKIYTRAQHDHFTPRLHAGGNNVHGCVNYRHTYNYVHCNLAVVKLFPTKMFVHYKIRFMNI